MRFVGSSGLGTCFSLPLLHLGSDFAQTGLGLAEPQNDSSGAPNADGADVQAFAAEFVHHDGTNNLAGGP